MYEVGQVVESNHDYDGNIGEKLLTKGERYEIVKVNPMSTSGYLTVVNEQGRQVAALWGCFNEVSVELEVIY